MSDSRTGPGWESPKLTLWCSGIAWSGGKGEVSVDEAGAHRECRTSGGWRMCACLCHVPQWMREQEAE